MRPMRPEDRGAVLVLLGHAALAHRRPLRPVLRVEARAEPVRTVARLGRDVGGSSRRPAYVRALGIRPSGRTGAHGCSRGGHRDASRLPGPEDLQPAHPARDRTAAGGRRRLHLQHTQRQEPSGLPQDGVAGGRPAARRGASLRAGWHRARMLRSRVPADRWSQPSSAGEPALDVLAGYAVDRLLSWLAPARGFARGARRTTCAGGTGSPRSRTGQSLSTTTRSTAWRSSESGHAARQRKPRCAT